MLHIYWRDSLNNLRGSCVRRLERMRGRTHQRAGKVGANGRNNCHVPVHTLCEVAQNGMNDGGECGGGARLPLPPSSPSLTTASFGSRVGNLAWSLAGPLQKPGPAEGGGSRCGQAGKRDDGCLWDCSGWQAVCVCDYVMAEGGLWMLPARPHPTPGGREIGSCRFASLS